MFMLRKAFPKSLLSEIRSENSARRSELLDRRASGVRQGRFRPPAALGAEAARG